MEYVTIFWAVSDAGGCVKVYPVIGETANSFEFVGGWHSKAGTFIRFDDEAAANRVRDVLAEVRDGHSKDRDALRRTQAGHWDSVVRMFTPTPMESPDA